MHELPLLTTFTIGLLTALVFGYITCKMKLSPIIGYVLAGIVVGPSTPGIVADTGIASQFAEIGVVLLLFGVGLHFNLKDLLSVKWIAIPGAVAQSAVSAFLGAVAAHCFGWSIGAGLVLGMSLSVASTVMLARMLSDNALLETSQGHVSIGWLVAEDLFTVFLLVTLPLFVAGPEGMPSLESLSGNMLWSLAKLVALGFLMLKLGVIAIPWLMRKVAATRSVELFTLAALVVALSVALGSAYVFGVSIALGAFLAGMVVGQSELSHQASANVLPMRDAFAVLFFVSIGMLFDPAVVVREPWLLVTVLFIILLGKPLTALFIVSVLGYSARTALTVAIGLAQIGEFSFILGEQARSLKLLPEEGYSILIAAALISLALNPLLFRGLRPLETWLASKPFLWRLLNFREQRREEALEPERSLGRSKAIVVGYGPVGRTMLEILDGERLDSTVIEMNVETIARLKGEGRHAIYGDASQREVLNAAGIHSAKLLLVTVPDGEARIAIVSLARILNPALKILVRAHYLSEMQMLERVGSSKICYEEIEATVSLAELLLRELGEGEKDIVKRRKLIRSEIEGRGRMALS